MNAVYQLAQRLREFGLGEGEIDRLTNRRGGGRNRKAMNILHAAALALLDPYFYQLVWGPLI